MPPTASAPGSASAEPPSLPAGVSVDPGLLEVLPARVDGVLVVPDPTTAVGIAGDPALAESAVSIAVAVAAASAESSEDFAVASVVRLRPDVFDEPFFVEWRETYDAGACEVAGGLVSEGETRIGGRQVFTGTCAGGAHTYHTLLEEQGFIVSVTATGPRRLGELILAGLAG